MELATMLMVALSCALLFASEAQAQGVACANPDTALGRHNSLRAKHVNTPGLAWSASLAQSSAAYSAVLAASQCNLVHSGGNYGENLYMMWGTSAAGVRSVDCDEATQAWYDEISQYVYSSTPWSTNQANFHAIGHFTQVVWKSTTQVGCGRAYGTRNTQYGAVTCVVITCQYLPPGNWADDGQFLANVQPVGSGGGPTPTPTASPPPFVVTLSPPPFWTVSPPPPQAAIMSPPPPSGGGFTYGGCQDSQAFLSAQNMYRAAHGVPALTWSNELAGTALSWSQYLSQPGVYCQKIKSFKLTPVGENIWVLPYATTTCSGAAAQWYSQGASYSYSSTPFTDNVMSGSSTFDDFTQMVWRSTSQVGCGVATGSYADGSPCTVITCEYAVGGNTPATDAAYSTNVPYPYFGRR